jgi:hypothetical protein
MAVATIMAAVMLKATAVMVTAEARAMAVTLLVASGGSDGGNGGNGTTMDIHDAILPWYANIVDVRSDNNGNCAPGIDRGNIDG